MIRRNAVTVSTQIAEDLAFLALKDVCQVTGGREFRVVGGQMVHLLLAAYPTEGAIVRRTADADIAIDIEYARSGVLHDQLEAAEYSAESGNSYARDGRQIDILVPSTDGRFRSEVHGGRGFDAIPGLVTVLAAEPIWIDVEVTLTDQTQLAFAAPVPRVEHAVAIKALAYPTRLAEKDLVDIYNLLQLIDQHSAEEIGGWSLQEPRSSGVRRDVQRSLQAVAEQMQRRSYRQTATARELDEARLVALIHKHVSPPEVRPLFGGPVSSAQTLQQPHQEPSAGPTLGM